MDSSTISPEEYQLQFDELSDQLMKELILAYSSLSYGEHRHYYFPSIFAFGLLGLITNTLNLVVLTRKKMINPINVFLSALAIADLALIVTQLPSCIHYFFSHNNLFSFSWVIAEIVLIILEIMFQLFRNWLVVTIAVWGFVSLQWYLRTPELCSMSRAKKALIVLVVTSIILCSPLGALLTWKEEEILNRKLYTKQYVDIAMQNDHIILEVFWGGLLLVSLIPCLVLLIFVVVLIVLYSRHNRGAPPESIHQSPGRRKIIKATSMLIVILALFILSNLPDASLQLASFIVGTDSDSFNGTKNATDLLRVFGLVTNSVNFFIYYFMSSKFRKTFKECFCCCCLKQTDQEVSDQSRSEEDDVMAMTTLKSTSTSSAEDKTI